MEQPQVADIPSKIRESRDVIRCCFQLNETDIDCLIKLLEIGGNASSEVLAESMRLSKTTVETSLKRLIDSGLVVREKTDERRVGRPKFSYKVRDNLASVIREGLENCSKKMKNAPF